MNHVSENGQCCPPFDPAPWADKEVVWHDKLFIKDTIPQFLHVPLPGIFARTVERMWNALGTAEAAPDMKDFLMLAHDPSPWKSELYMSATKEVPDTENVRLTGTFLTKVFDGPYDAASSWIKDMDAYAGSKGKEVIRYYFYYTTCPGCAKICGHNYTVAFAQVK